VYICLGKQYWADILHDHVYLNYRQNMCHISYEQVQSVQVSVSGVTKAFKPLAMSQTIRLWIRQDNLAKL
jgi:hypothetical protein